MRLTVLITTIVGALWACQSCLFAISERELQPYELYRNTLTYLETGRVNQIEKEIVDLQQARLDDFVVKRVRLELAIYYAEIAEFELSKQIIRLYLMQNGSSDPVLYPRVLRLLTEIAIAESNPQDALRYYRELVVNYPESDVDLSLLGSLRELFPEGLRVTDILDTFSDNLTYLDGLFELRDYGGVIRHALFMQRRFVRHARTPEIQYYQGLAYYNLFKFRDVDRVLSLAISGLSNITLKRKIYYYWARALYQARDYKRAEDFLKRVINMPNDPIYEPSAYYYLARRYWETNRTDEYEELYQQFERYYPQSMWFRQLQWDDRWITLKNVDNEQKQTVLFDAFISPTVADSILRTYKTLLPEYRQKPVGQLLSLGIDRYPLSFRVTETLRRHLLPDNLLPSVFVEPSPADPRVKRIDELTRLGYWDILQEELQYRMHRSTGDDRLMNGYLLARLYHKLEDHYAAQDVISDLFSESDVIHGQVPHAFLTFMYPKAYWEYVSKYAKKYNVDPYLVLAVMREESHFRSDAKSGADALGLMQMVPSTGKDVATRLSVKWDGPDLLYDPEYSIQFGAFYLSWLSERFHGRLHYMLAGYNAGPGHARKWSQEYGLTESVETFLTDIPFIETRRYVRRVMDTYIIYKSLYKN